ncbi:hypothetical protein CEE36_04035 [candidate division TA06 bacterium B3_TA06]|uniref:Secretion system C-terminal sorting domain-containing protein n=1 Tax=candidate division TA06 bacterium B3_TA06 TaxID=2012487 RepID=A0A532V8Q1_UNCT6|nr:MAG: hypothetical protein CEE36_04035 [candidate division TA06 bacterium B3_TA06]
MKKVLVVLALCVPFATMLAVGLSLNPMATNKPFELHDLAMPGDTIELAEDEGDPSGLWGLPLYAGDRLAVRLTPPSYPFEIIAAAFVPISWSGEPDSWKEECNLVFFGASSGSDEEPTSEIGRLDKVAPYEEINWNVFDVSGLNMTINSGKFYFAVENRVDRDPGLALDFAKPLHHVSWIYADFDGMMWYPLDNVYLQGEEWMIGDSIDVILRVLGVVSGNVVELKPDVETSVSLASIVASGSTINYSIAEPGEVEITLWDALGRRVQTFYTGHADAGEHTLTWDASALPSGAYFIKLKTPSTVSTAKIVLID